MQGVPASAGEIWSAATLCGGSWPGDIVNAVKKPQLPLFNRRTKAPPERGAPMRLP